MIFRNLTVDGDWTFGMGRAAYAANERAIELNLQTRLLSWKGNCFFALEDGVDWKNRLDKGQRQNLLDELKTIILKSAGVVGVNSVTYNLDAQRRLSVTYDIQTIFSTSFRRVVAIAAGTP